MVIYHTSGRKRSLLDMARKKKEKEKPTAEKL